MNVVFDVKQKDGKVVKGIYLIQYQKPIKGGAGNRILRWANDSMTCFNADGTVNYDVNLIEAEFIKAYDEKSGTDLTEFYKLFMGSVLPRINPMYTRFPLVREVIRLLGE